MTKLFQRSALVIEISCSLLLFLGVNVQTLEIWEGFNVSPFMHSLHFFYSLGAILGSIISPPFLGTKGTPEEDGNVHSNYSLEVVGSQNISWLVTDI